MSWNCNPAAGRLKCPRSSSGLGDQSLGIDGLFFDPNYDQPRPNRSSKGGFLRWGYPKSSIYTIDGFSIFFHSEFMNHPSVQMVGPNWQLGLRADRYVTSQSRVREANAPWAPGLEHWENGPSPGGIRPNYSLKYQSCSKKRVRSVSRTLWRTSMERPGTISLFARMLNCQRANHDAVIAEGWGNIA